MAHRSLCGEAKIIIRLLYGAVAVAALLASLPPLSAQITFLNVPSTDILPMGNLYLEADHALSLLGFGKTINRYALRAMF